MLPPLPFYLCPSALPAARKKNRSECSKGKKIFLQQSAVTATGRKEGELSTVQPQLLQPPRSHLEGAAMPKHVPMDQQERNSGSKAV